MTREEFRDYVDFLRSQGEISYDVYSGLIDGIDTLEQEPKTGHWITKIKSDLSDDMWPTNPKCSECGGEPYYSNTIYNYKFCPYCGAKMTEPQESESIGPKKGNKSAYCRYLRYNVEGWYNLDSKEVLRRWRSEVEEMYESPIEKIYGELQTQMMQEDENMVMKVVRKVGVNVDKEELIKALQYDRNQYTKGYEDGKNEALDKIRAEIKTMSGDIETIADVLKILDKYMVESEG